MKPSPYKYITDVSVRNYQAYQLRLPEIKDDILYYSPYNLTSKAFAASTYGSMEKALVAAQQYRDNYFKEKGMDFYTHKVKSKKAPHTPRRVSPRNTSGVIGVLYSSHCKASGTYYCYIGIWQEYKNGKIYQRRKSYSCLLYGDDLAFELACIARWEHLVPEQPLVVTDTSAPPCDIPVPYILEKKHVNDR